MINGGETVGLKRAGGHEEKEEEEDTWSEKGDKREGKRWRMEGRGGSEDVSPDVQLLSQQTLF